MNTPDKFYKDYTEGECVILKKGGDVLFQYWYYDEEKEEGKYLTRPLRQPGYEFFNYNCHLESGVTLKDVFTYIDKNRELWQILFGNPRSIDEFVDEVMSTTEEAKDEGDEGISYFYVSPGMIEKWDKNESLDTMNFCSFSGKAKEGDVNYSISFQTPGLYRNYELVVDPTLMFLDATDLQNNPVVLGKKYPSLFEIVYGVIWELTWYGNKTEREEKANEIKQASKDIDEGNYVAIDADDFLNKVKEKLDKK